MSGRETLLLKASATMRSSRHHVVARAAFVDARSSRRLSASRATISLCTAGRARTLPLTATRSGSTITLKASAKSLAALRSALRRHGNGSASVVVTATTSDGVTDTAAIVWSYR